jgi:radical SAM superfamily enzyme YgiQ (UPF0313 family)
MPDIVLCTLNARYVHASLGLRYLAANLGELAGRAKIMEFVLGARPADMVELVLNERPRMVGFGVYIWNVEETAKTVALMKQVAPEVTVVIGGPEVSYELEGRRIVEACDYVVTGPGDIVFAQLCHDVLEGKLPAQKIIAGEQPDLAQIELPYALYTDEDVARRFLYVEASRGCPFKCEFCLSALDKTAWPFPLQRFLEELAGLHARGARHFRFVDRTFNLALKASLAILDFFHERLDQRLSVHFEVIPDHLPEPLKQSIARFPKGVLQFEAGIQTWNTEVQALISRKQDNARAEQNLRWLREHALVHADLIAGLPGEDLTSFGAGFDRLVALAPQEIQVGILKRLRGTPIARHTASHAMRYNPEPPYNVLVTDCIDFGDMQRLNRFARYWDLIANSGRFSRTLTLLLGEKPFQRFMSFSDWLFRKTGKTHEIALDRLFDLVHEYLQGQGEAEAALAADYATCGARGAPLFLQARVRQVHKRGLEAASDRRRARQARQANT